MFKMTNAEQGEFKTMPPPEVVGSTELKANVGDGDRASEVKNISSLDRNPAISPGDAGDAGQIGESASVDVSTKAVATNELEVTNEFTQDIAAADQGDNADVHSVIEDTPDAIPASGPDCDAAIPEGPVEPEHPPDPRCTGSSNYSDSRIRVLKPPGGGSSDIFGAPEPVQNSPRRVRNNLQSSVFGPPANGEITPRNKAGSNSYSRLFGPAESRPQSASKNRLKSNIFLDDSTSPPKNKNLNLPVKNSSAVDGLTTKASMPRRNPVTGDGMYFKEIRRSARRRDGNPVTGEGYANANGELKKPAASNAEPTAPTTNGTNETSRSAPPQRTRVPPGGFSSGLW